jgi:hypothetical protein
MTMLVPSLLMRFDIELADGSQEPKQHCWWVYSCIETDLFANIHRWFVKQEGLNMTFVPRTSRCDSPISS